MAKIKMTNYNLALEVARHNSNIASALDYQTDILTGQDKINAEKLSLFELNPQLANEFIETMSNQIVAMYAYDIFREFDLPFTFALKTMSQFGDAENYVTAELGEASDYVGDGADPFNASKPIIYNNFIKTELKKQIGSRIAQDVWAGAFLNEGGLANIVGIIIKNLRDVISLEVYDHLRKYVCDTTVFSKYHTITSIAGAGETANAQKAYEEIMALVNKMSLPSDQFNTAGKKTITPRGRYVLLLNADYKASFDINVLASLFHESDIQLSKYFKEVRVVEFDDTAAGTNQVGMILDDEALVWGFRLNKAGSIYNPRTMEMNTWLNSWIKVGALKTRNAVRLTVA